MNRKKIHDLSLANDYIKLLNSNFKNLETNLFLPLSTGRVGEGGRRKMGYFKLPYTDKPLITIITVTYNCKNFLECTLKSILSQSYPNIECILIDGGSDDGTIDLIKGYESDLDYWVSEPDSGIYDAMNKGISLALGDYIGILNAGDGLYEEAISYYVNEINKNGADVVCATIDILDSDSKLKYVFKPLKSKGSTIYRMPFAHMSAYIKRDVFDRIGLYSLDYKLSADFDFFYKIIERREIVSEVECSVGYFREGGVSSDLLKSLLDTKRIISKNRGRVYSILWFIFRCFRSFFSNFFKKIVFFLGL